jgi:hypothetical protein
MAQKKKRYLKPPDMVKDKDAIVGETRSQKRMFLYL